MKNNSKSRIRGRKLQEIRKRHFVNNPLCVMCHKKGIIELATELDHIIALVNGGEDTIDNMQGLCKKCHEEKTRQDMGYYNKPLIGLDGYPVEND